MSPDLAQLSIREQSHFLMGVVFVFLKSLYLPNTRSLK
jgi:hypothetical protein